MTDDALARAEANFGAAKELCRTGHADHGCTYGGMSAQHGYWLATEDCPLGHGETCDLRAVCDGDPTVTGFIGSEPDPGIWYWVWRVTACQRCADLYADAHPEWKRPDAARVGVWTAELPRPEQTFGTPVAPSTFLPLTAPPPPPESGISPGTFGKLREAMNREGLEP